MKNTLSLLAIAMIFSSTPSVAGAQTLDVSYALKQSVNGGMANSIESLPNLKLTFSAKTAKSGAGDKLQITCTLTNTGNVSIKLKSARFDTNLAIEGKEKKQTDKSRLIETPVVEIGPGKTLTESYVYKLQTADRSKTPLEQFEWNPLPPGTTARTCFYVDMKDSADKVEYIAILTIKSL